MRAAELNQPPPEKAMAVVCIIAPQGSPLPTVQVAGWGRVVGGRHLAALWMLCDRLYEHDTMPGAGVKRPFSLIEGRGPPNYSLENRDRGGTAEGKVRQLFFAAFPSVRQQVSSMCGTFTPASA